MYTHKLLPLPGFCPCVVFISAISGAYSCLRTHTKSYSAALSSPSPSLSVELLVLQDTYGSRLAIKKQNQTHYHTCSEKFCCSTKAKYSPLMVYSEPVGIYLKFTHMYTYVHMPQTNTYQIM